MLGHLLPSQQAGLHAPPLVSRLPTYKGVEARRLVRTILTRKDWIATLVRIPHIWQNTQTFAWIVIFQVQFPKQCKKRAPKHMSCAWMDWHES